MKPNFDALVSFFAWLLAAFCVVCALCVVMGVLLWRGRKNKVDNIECSLKPSVKDQATQVTQAIEAVEPGITPSYVRVPPKMHWTTCNADWCRPMP